MFAAENESFYISYRRFTNAETRAPVIEYRKGQISERPKQIELEHFEKRMGDTVLNAPVPKRFHGVVCIATTIYAPRNLQMSIVKLLLFCGVIFFIFTVLPACHRYK